jgi:hypothetical protein
VAFSNKILVLPTSSSTSDEDGWNDTRSSAEVVVVAVAAKVDDVDPSDSALWTCGILKIEENFDGTRLFRQSTAKDLVDGQSPILASQEAHPECSGFKQY